MFDVFVYCINAQRDVMPTNQPKCFDLFFFIANESQADL